MKNAADVAAARADRRSVDKVTSLVAEVAAASDEQAQGIDQINIAVSDMDTVTQRTRRTPRSPHRPRRS